jgi:protein O-mannosyl-transferase
MTLKFRDVWPVKNWKLIVVILVSAAAYLNTVGHQFVMDDQSIITKNKFTQQGFGGVIDHLTHSYWFGYNGKNEGNYRPITGVSFAIEHALFGDSAAIGHLLNVLFYTLLCSMLLLWLNRIGWLDPTFNMVLVLLFAVHPVHTEVVANIKSRDEIYCFLFLILSLLYFQKWLESANVKALAISGLWLLLSLLSKETSVAMLPVYLVVAFRKKANWGEALKATIGPSIATAVYLLIYFGVTRIMDKTEFDVLDNALVQQADSMDLLATKFWIVGSYFKLLLLPTPLFYDYGFNTVQISSLSDPLVLISLAVLVGLFALFIVKVRKIQELESNSWLLALGFLLLPLVPVTNFVVNIGSTMAERFLFMPSFGFLLLVFLFIARFVASRQKVMIVSSSLVALLFFSMTINRNEDWQSNETLYVADIEMLPNGALAHQRLATVYQIEGDRKGNRASQVAAYRKAIPLLEKAISIHPYPDFYRQLGELYGATDQWKLMIEAEEKFVALDSSDAEVWMQLGVAHAMTQKARPAARAFEKALELNPTDITTMNNLAKTYAALKRPEEAVKLFNNALELEPTNAIAIEGLISLELESSEAPLE